MRFRLPPLRRAALSVLALAPLAAAAPARAQGPAAPADDGLRIVLLTMGPGDAVWEKFGHNAIWVHDPARGTDLAYNYGMFDFAQENFLSNFIKGRMWYWMEGFDAELTLSHYRAQNRSVWAQELNLTPQQAAAMRDFLEANALPQNRFYRYDYYRDNCSTRVRDALDRVLGGALRAASGSAPSGTTYRWHTRRLTADAGDVATYTGLEGGLGPNADRPISRWEEMFLPMKLRDGVRAVRVRDAAGSAVPLVRSERVLFEAARPPERSGPPSRWMAGYLVAGLALAGALLLLASRVARSRLARFGFSALAALWLLFAGTGGWILVALWAFTDHEIAYRNENILQLSPLALPLVLLLPALAYGARWAGRWAERLALAVAALSVLGFVLQVLPGLDQVNGEIIALALPVNLALAWIARRLAAALPPREAAPRRAPAPRRAAAAA
ncbi:MAG TPA: DUF4105 domain-containing protein [Longimicrobium sp.]|jgi:hypothetical protein